ncbi:PREDICTED: interleukin-12 receptor subunit beta-1 [Charadrius vociferus]|uniref:interleukin-12 receptor subunit beta-1 n=1 Tax=Charadrius vociferus TaxID=50402 RepID=UPI000521C1F1|nr:PREDICTED: interleukin-12 receptor subunit beta-1 [Charadrius vociferus]
MARYTRKTERMNAGRRDSPRIPKREAKDGVLQHAVPPDTCTAAAPDFSCWKQCRSRQFQCSWPPHGPAGNTSYLLTLCYAKPRLCQRFEVGTGTTYTLNDHRVYVLTNATAWVEARWGDHVHRTPNLTLYLDKAIKLDPPPTGMPFTKTGGQLQLRVPWPPCYRRGQLPQWEARFQRNGDSSWTQVMCEMVTDKNDSVTCTLGRDGTFEVQLRHKLPHWSSYWSNWSSSIFIPDEILASPELSYQLGKLGRDGQRVLRLSWQRAPEQQGNVTYTLRTRMPACRCTKPAMEDTVELGTEVTAHNLTLSGAQYEILLTAVNAAGPGPAQQVYVPAEQRADLGFKDVSVAGSTVMAQWEAPSSGLVYCFEQQPLPEALEPGVCIRRDFPAKSIHVERDAEADAAASHFTLQNLRPGTTYRVGVWEVTAESGGTCSTGWRFQTKVLGPQGAAWKSNLKYLGILLGLSAVATVYQLSKRRARRLLFPPLPKPVGTKAIQFSTGETSQGQPRPGFVEPLERFSPAELLITELNPSKEMADAGTRPGTPQPTMPQPGPAVEEPVVVCPSGCEKELPFAYRRQEMLSPVGFPSPGSTGCSGCLPGKEEEEEEEEEGRRGLHQPLVPIALLISDKPVIIRDEEGWDPPPEKSVP